MFPKVLLRIFACKFLELKSSKSLFFCSFEFSRSSYDDFFQNKPFSVYLNSSRRDLDITIFQ